MKTIRQYFIDFNIGLLVRQLGRYGGTQVTCLLGNAKRSQTVFLHISYKFILSVYYVSLLRVRDSGAGQRGEGGGCVG